MFFEFINCLDHCYTLMKNIYWTYELIDTFNNLDYCSISFKFCLMEDLITFYE